jgi:hypothetical protein
MYCISILLLLGGKAKIGWQKAHRSRRVNHFPTVSKYINQSIDLLLGYKNDNCPTRLCSFVHLWEKGTHMEAKMPTKAKEAYKRKEEEIIPVSTLLCVHDGYDEVSAPYFRQRLVKKVKKVYHKRSPISAEKLNHNQTHTL